MVGGKDLFCSNINRGGGDRKLENLPDISHVAGVRHYIEVGLINNVKWKLTNKQDSSSNGGPVNW